MRAPVRNQALLMLAITILAVVLPTQAGVIDQYTIHTSELSNPELGGDFLGQSFTTPDGGPWSDVTFNFLSDGNAVAAGTAYLFTAPADLPPSDLNTATDLATSTGVTMTNTSSTPHLPFYPTRRIICTLTAGST
jgi:hypothetical protein